MLDIWSAAINHIVDTQTIIMCLHVGEYFYNIIHRSDNLLKIYKRAKIMHILKTTGSKHPSENYFFANCNLHYILTYDHLFVHKSEIIYFNNF